MAYLRIYPRDDQYYFTLIDVSGEELHNNIYYNYHFGTDRDIGFRRRSAFKLTPTTIMRIHTSLIVEEHQRMMKQRRMSRMRKSYELERWW